MPIRDYLCDECHHQFEEIVHSRDPDEYKYARCPHCEAVALVLPARIGAVAGTKLSDASPKNRGCYPKTKVFTGDKPKETPSIDRHTDEEKTYD
jgi:putative FmdB family regulatory protein